MRLLYVSRSREFSQLAYRRSAAFSGLGGRDQSAMDICLAHNQARGGAGSLESRRLILVNLNTVPQFEAPPRFVVPVERAFLSKVSRRADEPVAPTRDLCRTVSVHRVRPAAASA